MNSNRELRLPTKMKDGDIYFGEWNDKVREGKGLQITTKDANQIQIWIGWTFKKAVYGESMLLQKNGVGLFGSYNA